MPKQFWVRIFVFLFLASQIMPPQVKAAISSCTVSVSPSEVSINGSPNLSFTIVNTDSNAIVWVRITAPGSGFTITSGSLSGWNVSVDSSTQITFSGQSLSAGADMAPSVSVTTGGSAQSSQNWTVAVSDNSGGSSPFTCTGSTGVTISDADETGPVISSLSLSDVSQTSVKFTWTTDEAATSVVYYGTTNSYGSTKSDSSLVTSHSVEISGLNANTTYHYNISSSDSSGNESQSGDNTFVSSKAATTSTTTVTETKTETKTVIKIVEDTTKPVITVSTDFKKFYTQSPKISGTATDNIGVTVIEYSTDEGKNWLPVDSQGTIGAKSSAFSFTPLGLDDGSYEISVRAIDPSGNSAISKSYTLVIDRLPPSVGGMIFSVGPQLLTPQADGTMRLLSRLDHKLTVSEVGGTIQIDIIATPTEPNSPLKKYQFPMYRDGNSGLWSATIHFDEPGTYALRADALDGAENKTTRALNQVLVVANGRILAEKNPVTGATVTLYVKNEDRHQFFTWQSQPYNQINPQRVSGAGEYVFVVPAGTYYFDISAVGHKRVRTGIFTIDQPTSLTGDITLAKEFGFQLGPWYVPFPDVSELTGTKTLSYQPYTQTSTAEAQFPLLHRIIPHFEFNTDGGVISTLDLRGKPTIISLLTNWLPQVNEQLSQLSNIRDNSQIHLTPIMMQQSVTKTTMFKARGGYELPILSDPDGILIEPLAVTSLPAHIFIDRRGVVQKVRYGFLSSDELLDSVVN